jgi:hypothetical protein
MLACGSVQTPTTTQISFSPIYDRPPAYVIEPWPISQRALMRGNKLRRYDGKPITGVRGRYTTDIGKIVRHRFFGIYQE